MFLSPTTFLPLFCSCYKMKQFYSGLFCVLCFPSTPRRCRLTVSKPKTHDVVVFSSSCYASTLWKSESVMFFILLFSRTCVKCSQLYTTWDSATDCLWRLFTTLIFHEPSWLTVIESIRSRIQRINVDQRSDPPVHVISFKSQNGS